MDKKHILDEIRRTAKENGGSPLGQARFHHHLRSPAGMKAFLAAVRQERREPGR